MRFPAYSRAGAYLGDIPEVLSAERTRNVDGTDRLELKCTGTDLQKDDRVLVRCRDAWREFAVVSVSRERASSAGALTAVCRNSVSELSRKYVLEREGRSYTASQALDKALDGTRWERGTVDAPGTANVSFYHQSALESIEDICAAFDCELDATVEVDGAAVSRRLVHLRAHVGGQAARRRFEYSRDLVSIRRTVSADDVVTRLYPWGRGVETEGGGYSRKVGIADVNGGVPYIEDVEATRRFGIPDAQGVPQPAEGSYENGDVDDPGELLKLARADLSRRSAPIVSYEASVAVMAEAGEGIEGAACGDAVQIVDTEFQPPLRLEGRVLQTVEDLVGDLSRSSITLGNVVEGITGRSQRVEAAVQKLTGSAGAWDDAAGLGEGYLNGVIDGLNAVMNETGGYVYLDPGRGIFVYDRPVDKGPTMCVQVGGGFIRIADGKTPDGEWDFRTLGNGHGVLADALYAGEIVGGANRWNLETGDLQFSQGGIRDSKGRNHWNLDTGEFSLSPGSEVGGSQIGKTVVRADVQYGLSASASSVPTEWGSTMTWRSGMHTWQRTMMTSIDGSVSYTAAQHVVGADGIGVSGSQEQYYLSTSSAAPAGGSWTASQPAWVKGRHYWTRTRIDWSDGTTTYTEPVLARALTSGSQSTDDLDSALDQRGVFNRLTKDGALQGIYMSGGLLYINATYLETGVISDRLGRNTWNLATGALTTNYMKASNIDASGTFSCGSASNLLRLVGGAIHGYENGEQIGQIDFSAHSYNIDNPSIKYKGIQMTAHGTARISTPQIATAVSNDSSVTATICTTGDHTMRYISDIRDDGDGTISWTWKTRSINFKNGLCTFCGFD